MDFEDIHKDRTHGIRRSSVFIPTPTACVPPVILADLDLVRKSSAAAERRVLAPDALLSRDTNTEREDVNNKSLTDSHWLMALVTDLYRLLRHDPKARDLAIDHACEVAAGCEPHVVAAGLALSFAQRTALLIGLHDYVVTRAAKERNDERLLRWVQSNAIGPVIPLLSLDMAAEISFASATVLVPDNIDEWDRQRGEGKGCPPEDYLSDIKWHLGITGDDQNSLDQNEDLSGYAFKASFGELWKDGERLARTMPPSGLRCRRCGALETVEVQ